MSASTAAVVVEEATGPSLDGSLAPTTPPRSSMWVTAADLLRGTLRRACCLGVVRATADDAPTKDGNETPSHEWSLRTVETSSCRTVFETASRFRQLTLTVTPAASSDFVILDERAPATFRVAVARKLPFESTALVKTDADFAALKADVCAALAYGHRCDGICPWFFVDFRSVDPSRSYWFRADAAARAASHQLLLDLLVNFVSWPHRQSCQRATVDIPRLFFAFLGLPFDRMEDDELASPVHDGFRCTLCQTTHAAAVTSITRLPCGHTFHDECIVAALNKDLDCPSCVDAPLGA
ncbi:Aste57867_11177 [Aphanomyces stellatus]|uniref:Aste57867_11177 protein n=1 Tax=Aphanomyces stellatus TaxID=120398 RepID=A0A485KTG4_9STRA|nr:hypothetical protein As57867_011135 [Aphanomyces stellatus]VFT88044.1 Aste57867_11177 [Aphanomyces stellatus]